MNIKKLFLVKRNELHAFLKALEIIKEYETSKRNENLVSRDVDLKKSKKHLSLPKSNKTLKLSIH